MRIDRIVSSTLATLLVLGSLGIAQAKSGEQDGRDAAALAGTKVSLTQAIAAAEQQGGGKAVGADISQEGGVVRIAVEVAGPQGVRTMLVDGQTGQVSPAPAGQDAEDND